MEQVKYRCPNCKQKYRSPATWEGKEKKCDVCGTAFICTPEQRITQPTPLKNGSWFYAGQNGEQLQAKELEIKNLLQSGQISTDTLVWRNGMECWQSAKECPEFQHHQYIHDNTHKNYDSFRQDNPKNTNKKWYLYVGVASALFIVMTVGGAYIYHAQKQKKLIEAKKQVEGKFNDTENEIYTLLDTLKQKSRDTLTASISETAEVLYAVPHNGDIILWTIDDRPCVGKFSSYLPLKGDISKNTKITAFKILESKTPIALPSVSSRNFAVNDKELKTMHDNYVRVNRDKILDDIFNGNKFLPSDIEKRIASAKETYDLNAIQRLRIEIIDAQDRIEKYIAKKVAYYQKLKISSKNKMKIEYAQSNLDRAIGHARIMKNKSSAIELIRKAIENNPNAHTKDNAFTLIKQLNKEINEAAELSKRLEENKRKKTEKKLAHAQPQKINNNKKTVSVNVEELLRKIKHEVNQKLNKTYSIQYVAQSLNIKLPLAKSTSSKESIIETIKDRVAYTYDQQKKNLPSRSILCEKFEKKYPKANDESADAYRRRILRHVYKYTNETYPREQDKIYDKIHAKISKEIYDSHKFHKYKGTWYSDKELMALISTTRSKLINETSAKETSNKLNDLGYVCYRGKWMLKNEALKQKEIDEKNEIKALLSESHSRLQQYISYMKKYDYKTGRFSDISKKQIDTLSTTLNQLSKQIKNHNIKYSTEISRLLYSLSLVLKCKLYDTQELYSQLQDLSSPISKQNDTNPNYYSVQNEIFILTCLQTSVYQIDFKRIAGIKQAKANLDARNKEYKTLCSKYANTPYSMEYKPIYGGTGNTRSNFERQLGSMISGKGKRQKTTTAKIHPDRYEVKLQYRDGTIEKGVISSSKFKKINTAMDNSKKEKMLNISKTEQAQKDYYALINEYKKVKPNIDDCIKIWSKRLKFLQNIKTSQLNLPLTEHRPKKTVSFDDLKKSAEQGDAKSQCILGACYASGRGTQKDSAKAYEWYRKSAEQGNADAQYLLALYYEQGAGVSKDSTKAFKWFRKSAEQGNPDAQYFLGLYYEQGVGVSKDLTKAFKWFRKSAEQDNAKAQCILGACYDMGVGTHKDSAKALVWYRKSAEQGNEVAKKWINNHK